MSDIAHVHRVGAIRANRLGVTDDGARILACNICGEPIHVVTQMVTREELL